MNYVKLNTNNSREAILIARVGSINTITDQVIEKGDAIIHQMYSNPMDTGLSTFVVTEITEERPGRGHYPKSNPPTFRSLNVERKVIPYKELEEKGYVRVSQVTENGKQITKAQLL